MKNYVVMAIDDYSMDAYAEEYSGIKHETREKAHEELINSKSFANLNGYSLYIKEVHA